MKVAGCEFIPDAYEAILEVEKAGLMVLERYSDLSENKKNRIEQTIKEEYRRQVIILSIGIF